MEFFLSKSEYEALTGRESKGKDDVIAYQIRQAFYPGEITPEEANKLGYELAMQFTKGQHAFIVATHVDKAHVHNHIVFNSTTLDCTHKFNNYKGTADVVRSLSDKLCLEHGYSVITEPSEKGKTYAEWNAEKCGNSWKAKLRRTIDAQLPGCRDFDHFLRRMEQAGYEIKRGKNLSFRAPGQQRFTRAKTLGDDYTEEAIRLKISGPVTQQTVGKEVPLTRTDISFLIDIQKKLSEGKGAGYEQWAKVFNIKQKANALILAEQAHLASMEEITEHAETAEADFNLISDQLKETERRLRQAKDLRKHIRNYGRTCEVYKAYRKAKDKDSFYEEHRADIQIHEAAKRALDESGLKSLPSVKTLNAQIEDLSAQQKNQYETYCTTREESRKWQAVKQNIASILGEAEKEKHHGLDR